MPDEIDTQRARRILDAIRNRLGDSLSPQQERDYLERLLQTSLCEPDGTSDADYLQPT